MGNRSGGYQVRLGASFEHWWNHSYLIRKRASTEVTKRELESSIAALDVDLQSD
jgi:hypothetical protein